MKQKGIRGIAVGMTISLLGLCTFPVEAAEPKEWTIGYETNKNGPVDAEQGENGWYFLYSEEIGTDGELDTEKLEECEWITQKASIWFLYGASYMWLPSVYLGDDYDPYGNSNWWWMDSNGRMDINVAKGAVRSVVAWEAPEDGKYSIDLNYKAGSQSYEWEGNTYFAGDGLTFSINNEEEVLEKAFAEAATEEKPEISSGTMKVETELSKGERIYFSVDPGKDGGCDVTKIQASIKQVEKGVSGVKGLQGLLKNKMVVVIAAVVIGVGVGAAIGFMPRKKKK